MIEGPRKEKSSANASFELTENSLFLEDEEPDIELLPALRLDSTGLF